MTDGATLATHPPHMVTAARFSAVTDAFVYESAGSGRTHFYQRGHDNRAKIWAISIAGSQTSVRAIRANLLKGEQLEISRVDEEGDPVYGSREPMVKGGDSPWTWSEMKLPGSKAHHTLVYPKLAELDHGDKDFLILGRCTEERTEEELAWQHYRRLNARLDLPMHPQWSRWLWERALAEEEAKELRGLNLAGWLCKPDRESLQKDISEAVKLGLLKVR